jgi:Flp pilus assembly protein TadD
MKPPRRRVPPPLPTSPKGYPPPRPPAARPAAPAARKAPVPEQGGSFLLWAALGSLLAVLLVAVLALLVLRMRPSTPATNPAPALPGGTEDFKEDEPISREFNPTLDPAAPSMRMNVELTVDAVGDARQSGVFSTQGDILVRFKQALSVPYVENKELKWREPNMRHVLAFLDLESAESVTEELAGRFDGPTIRLSSKERGWARRLDGRWSHTLTTKRDRKFEITRKTYKDGVPTVSVDCQTQVQGIQNVEHNTITLPRGAHDIRIEGTPNRLTYLAPAPRPQAGSNASPRLTLEVKPHVMSALYKLYGDPRFEKLWVARGVFRNAGGEPVTECRVRFRLAGFSEWSRYETADVVLPGQTVVVPFYPVIDAKVRDLHASTPADVEVEYHYVRADGRKVSESTAERTKILGINEAVFTDTRVDSDSTWFERYKDARWVLGSFVSAADPVIQDLVGKVSKVTRGAGASLGDAEATAFLKGFYDMTRVNISYETTPGDVIDGLTRQHLKYGRDVVRTRSGTCVNTSILFASVAEAAGLDAFLWVVPGHAFAGARLPKSGKVVFVETTGCGGGTLETSMDFEQAVQSAAKTAQKWVSLGLIIEVNVRQLRRDGVVPPELPDAGRDALRDWVLPGTAAATPAPTAETTEPAPAAKGAAEYAQEGKEHLEAKRFEQAIESLSKAIDLAPENADYRNDRAKAYANLGDAANKEGDKDTALEWWSKAAGDVVKALELDPSNARTWNWGGVLMGRVGENRKALTFFSKAIELDPTFALAYRNRGITYRKLGENRLAQRDLEMADSLEGK